MQLSTVNPSFRSAVSSINSSLPQDRLKTLGKVNDSVYFSGDKSTVSFHEAIESLLGPKYSLTSTKSPYLQGGTYSPNDDTLIEEIHWKTSDNQGNDLKQLLLDNLENLENLLGRKIQIVDEATFKATGFKGYRKLGSKITLIGLSGPIPLGLEPQKFPVDVDFLDTIKALLGEQYTHPNDMDCSAWMPNDDTYIDLVNWDPEIKELFLSHKAEIEKLTNRPIEIGSPEEFDNFKNTHLGKKASLVTFNLSDRVKQARLGLPAREFIQGALGHGILPAEPPHIPLWKRPIVVVEPKPTLGTAPTIEEIKPKSSDKEAITAPPSKPKNLLRRLFPFLFRG